VIRIKLVLESVGPKVSVKRQFPLGRIGLGTTVSEYAKQPAALRFDLAAMRVDDHSVFKESCAGGIEPIRSLDFDNTETASTERFQSFVIT